MSFWEKMYWDDRALKMYKYKNESFYTITAVPYYYKRRETILKLLKECIERNQGDYGCGDGEDLRKLYTMFRGGNSITAWKGYDISPQMIKNASEICEGCKNIEFGMAEKGIPDGGKV